MLCIHHNDMDGRAAAHVVANVEWNFNPDRFFEWDYTGEFPFGKIQKDEKVYLVDCSIDDRTFWMLKRLFEITKNVVWIDHHVSSERLIERNPYLRENKNIFVKEGTSGAALAYMFLHGVDFGKIPTYLKYVSDYDCQHFDFGKDTEYFKCFIDSQDYGPLDDVWFWMENMHDSEFKKILEVGHSIRDYLTCHYAEVLSKQAYPGSIEGHDALIVNIEGNSWVFGDRIDEFPVCVLWHFDGSYYRYSLYSHTIDVSVIAEKFGGGGHPQAAGVQSQERIW